VSGERLLEVANLSTSFVSPRGLVRVIDDVSLVLDRGETLGIVGESGSGKSVLVRTIMNLLGREAVIAPETRVFFDGRDIRRLSAAQSRHLWGREIAMVFQDPMTSLNPVQRIGAQLTASASPRRGADSTSIRTSCRAACASASRSPSPSRANRSC
jgi:peptide/nickel transport system ATP-binding protein